MAKDAGRRSAALRQTYRDGEAKLSSHLDLAAALDQMVQSNRAAAGIGGALRAGWTIKRPRRLHRVLSRQGFPDFRFCISRSRGSRPLISKVGKMKAIIAQDDGRFFCSYFLRITREEGASVARNAAQPILVWSSSHARALARDIAGWGSRFDKP